MNKCCIAREFKAYPYFFVVIICHHSQEFWSKETLREQNAAKQENREPFFASYITKGCTGQIVAGDSVVPKWNSNSHVHCLVRCGRQQLLASCRFL